VTNEIVHIGGSELSYKDALVSLVSATCCMSFELF
jgi:hypothetical protein